MAYWSRRPTGQVRIWDKNGKNIPRKKYKHLDKLPDSSIVAWVQDYELRFEGKVWTPDQLTPDDWTSALESYLDFLLVRKQRDPATVNQYRKYITDYAFQFFLKEGVQDLAMWPSRSVDLVEHLEKLKVSQHIIFRTRIYTANFWAWLKFRQKVHADLPLMPVVLEAKSTPLQTFLEPKDVVAYVQSTEDRDLKLIALLGYFFSLRPQEIFAAGSAEFSVGAAAEKLECCHKMKGINLFGKLAIQPTSQRNAKKAPKKLKTQHSQAWIACFNQEAARLFVEVLRDGQEFFPRDNRHYYRLWAAKGMKGVSIKDLRRASLYWLGHNTDINPFDLQKHARHKDFGTTQLYLRRPEEKTLTTAAADLHMLVDF